MKWIEAYDLFLFDLDGLLVNTEMLHFQAYVAMCRGRGCDLDWDFPKYCSLAHLNAEAVRNEIYAKFPALYQQEPDWRVLYNEKKRAYLHILNQGAALLMPGAEALLLAVQQAEKKRCVVTHSMKELVDVIRNQNAILNTIPNWLTREDYSDPKPHPAGYLKAIERLASPSDKIIGFEDSIRGIRALMGTRAKPVMVNDIDEKARRCMEQEGVKVFRSLEDVLHLNKL